MTPQPGSILFDFDYTLVDPSRGIEACINYGLQGLGLPAVPMTRIRQALGLSLPDTFRELAGPAQAGRYDEFFALFLERAEAVMIRATDLFEATPATVKWLHRQGLKLGIVSQKYRPHIEPVLQRARLAAYFEVIVGGDDVSKPKPDPEGLNAALTRLGSSPAKAIYVGDSPLDAETARQAGLPFVAVLSGGSPRQAFQGYEVLDIVEDISGLPEVISKADE